MPQTMGLMIFQNIPGFKKIEDLVPYSYDCLVTKAMNHFSILENIVSGKMTIYKV